VKSGWQTKKLGNLCEIELGKTPARANKAFWDKKRETGNVWLSIADLLNAEDNIVADSKEYLSDKGAAISKIVRKGTLLASFKLTLGRLAFTGCDLFTNEAIAALTIFNERELSKEFLFYFLHFFDWRKAAENDVKLKGMTLNKAKLKEMPVHFPSPAEQQRIIGILDEAFEGIATAKANAEKNLQNARALFESYLQSVFIKSGKGWAEKTLDQISENLDSKRVPITKNIRTSGSIPYYGASGVVDYVKDYLFDEDLLCVSEDGANLLARTYPIAFSISGKTWVNNHAHVLRFKNIVSQKFVELYLNSIKLDDFVSGMAQPKLNQAMLNKIPIPFPPHTEQKSIVAKLDVLSAETKKLESIYQQKLAALEELKKSLLHQAFTGVL